jgi:hypothetical protein
MNQRSAFQHDEAAQPKHDFNASISEAIGDRISWEDRLAGTGGGRGREGAIVCCLGCDLEGTASTSKKNRVTASGTFHSDSSRSFLAFSSVAPVKSITDLISSACIANDDMRSSQLLQH